MFDQVYDNGKCVLGKIKWVKEYICKIADDPADIKEIVEDLEDFDEDVIVSLNYDHPMGYNYEYWTYENIVNKP